MAERVEGRKCATYPAWIERRKSTVGEFAPLVFEHYGRIGPMSLDFVRRLARRSASLRHLDSESEVQRWVELLGARVLLENALVLATG